MNSSLVSNKTGSIIFKILIPCWVVGLFTFNTAFAENIWQRFDGNRVPTVGRQVLVPDQYLIYALNQQALSHLLNAASADPENTVSIVLPGPDGGTRVFKIWKTPVMAPALQARYPGIQTFTAIAADNPAVSAKIEWSATGFHAMIFDADHTYFIDPYSDTLDGYYSVYYKKDYWRQEALKMNCTVTSEYPDIPGGGIRDQINEELPGIALRQHGSIKKTYRLALSCTGEYALAVGGSSPSKNRVFSVMATTINRVNGIYERELSITLEIIENNDTLLYLNPATDPFTANNNGDLLLDQNQSNTNMLIGNEAYDIGHIFSTGGGGIASLESICAPTRKAMGVTGSLNPVGDPFDVDYVAHEMGHQFGANHTFNYCSGNESQSTAFEPGGGSTIMSYAGICGTINNLQKNSDAYFHAASLDEISRFVTLGSGGAGGPFCGLSSGGNPPPVLPSIARAYYIPYQTPFELDAPAEPATENLLYCWEQWNLGDYMKNESAGSSFTMGPSLRSFHPEFQKTRVFPLIDSLLDNKIAYKGERLSNVNRLLKFKLTLRNLWNGWGAFDISEGTVDLNVVNTGTPFRVIFPDLGSDTLSPNTLQRITWDVARTNIAPINCSQVSIYLSIDGGYTYPLILAGNLPNTGSAAVVVPDIYSHTARIKIKGDNNVFFDISNKNIVLADATNPTALEDIPLNHDLAIYPNPAQQYIHIKSTRPGRLNMVLYNSLGQKVWSGRVDKDAAIAVSGYARGGYYMQIREEQSGATTVKKIVLQ